MKLLRLLRRVFGPCSPGRPSLVGWHVFPLDGPRICERCGVRDPAA